MEHRNQVEFEVTGRLRPVFRSRLMRVGGEKAPCRYQPTRR